MSHSKLNKFEITRVLSERTHQISNNAPSTVDITGLTNAFDIAMKELKEKKIPINVVRILPDGSKEEIKLYERNEP